MTIQLKVFTSWVLIWIVVGVIFSGLMIGLGDTGHVGPIGVILILLVASGIFGVIGGLVFALLFTWIVPRLSSRLARNGVAAALGALSGVLAMYVTDGFESMSYAFAIGSVGAVTGFVCAARTEPESGHHEGAV
jgi:hypothetical protein